MKLKHICVVTGSRAEYNYLKLIIEKIIESPKLKLSLIVTCMHLLKNYGYTIDLIKKDKIPITKIIQMYDEDERERVSLGKSVGVSVIKHTEVFHKLKPDFILLLGDRFEPFAAVIAASTLSIPIIHIHGGDISGGIDESIRHAITKLAHIHFPATPKSAERIRLLGEENWRIHMVGSTTIDLILKENLLEKEKICRELQLNAQEIIVVCIQHSSLNEYKLAGEYMKITLKVLRDLNLQTVIIYPNNDPGSDLIIQQIESVRDVPHFKIFKNLVRIQYLSLLKHSDLLIGNSSSGLIESPIFKTPVINIGERNKDRESAKNIISIPPEYEKIYESVKKALSQEFRDHCQEVKNPYGDGKATERIIKVIEELEINQKLLNKKLTYLF